MSITKPPDHELPIKVPVFPPQTLILNPCWDNVFKAMFVKDSPESRHALVGLLSALLDRTVLEVEVKNNEPAVASNMERQIRFDINCKFDNGELANIEMTMNPDKYEQERMEYYLAKLHTSQELAGTSVHYGHMKPAYQINIIDDNLFENNEFIHYYRVTDQEGEEVQRKGHTVVLELPKINYNKPVGSMSSLERWATFFRFAADESRRNTVNEIFKLEEHIAMAASTLLTISADEHEQARLLTEHKNKLDWQSKIAAAREDGLLDGEGIGVRKNRLETARILKDSGVELEIIVKTTTLSPEEIARL